MASNFNISAVGSAAWINDGSECRSDGRSVLQRLVAELRFRLETQSLPGLNGVVTQDSIPDDSSGWSFSVLQALYAVARSLGTSKVSSSYLAAMVTDIGSVATHRPISASTMRVALWLIWESHGFREPSGDPIYNAGSPTTISFPTGTVFPIAGTVPPMAANGTYNVRVCSAVGSAPPVTPITVPGVVDRSVPLLVALMVAGAIGVAWITKDAPKMADIRRRRNPARGK